MKFYVKDLENCKLKDLIKLCRFAGIDESSDFKRISLIKWLIYMGWAHDTTLGSWRK